MTVHLLERPTWTCRHDGRPWPCAGARVHLACRYDPVMLAVVMGEYLHLAARDLGEGVTPAELWTRFLAWVRHPLREHVTEVSGVDETSVDESVWGTAPRAYENGRTTGWIEAVRAALLLLKPWPDAATVVAGLRGGPPRDMPPEPDGLAGAR